ncbi:MAG: hypothetical protein AUJ92_15235 [Armatimonadetes bacterium CG2_30_59_28]|nr:hypothetical protein [Armatimonadota bacterium]OIO91972.1 MAG: hypothetical protein AUJ92_15235 [Armatimonadetes bacterium CG2_30_59_28]PIU66702.1 MAG: hypothetical protein COS85_03785 [Armatimonadetes bacterium CG07_land_8_20_14_0_80_59_28]PIX39189.1 MAG: hypothetical protein COZ56_18390 [Armatimonadetes bacterium CG_4_8_14_3_um_filter_58_9]PIY39388.1 MAG: hypothetical protein COZ05_19290 [Armatimonadetes bacterium CG_4_10_14_3_um_filter_59_10]
MNLYRHLFPSVCLCIVTATVSVVWSGPSTAKSPPKLVMIIVSSSRLSDWYEHSPVLERLLTDGAPGLVNFFPSRLTRATAWMTAIGTGRPDSQFLPEPPETTPLTRLLKRHDVKLCVRPFHSDGMLCQYAFGTNIPRAEGAAQTDMEVVEIGWWFTQAVGRDLLWRDVDAEILRLVQCPNPTNTTVLVIGMSRTESLFPLLYATPDDRYRTVSSQSTRWQGLVSVVDIAPTILSFFNIPLSEAREAGMIGMPIQSVPAPRFPRESPVEYVKRLDQWTSRTHAASPLTNTLFAAYVWSVILIGFLILQITRERRSRIDIALAGLLAATYLISLSFIPLGYLNYLLSGRMSLLATAAAIGLSLLMMLPATRGGRNGVEFWVRATSLLILLDIFLHFSRFSPLSFALVTGSRFYGMGNEYASVLISSLLLSVGLSRAGKDNAAPAMTVVLFACVSLFATLTLGHSSLGANFGGSVTAAAALGTSTIALICPRWTWKQTATALVIVLLAAAASGLDFVHPYQQQSHIGRTFQLALPEIWGTAQRKLAMNQRFIATTPGSLILLPILISLSAWIYSSRRFPRSLDERFPLLRRALFGAPVGMVAGFLINDSGVVVLAIMAATYLTVLYSLLFGHRGSPSPDTAPSEVTP